MTISKVVLPLLSILLKILYFIKRFVLQNTAEYNQNILTTLIFLQERVSTFKLEDEMLPSSPQSYRHYTVIKFMWRPFLRQ